MTDALVRSVIVCSVEFVLPTEGLVAAVCTAMVSKIGMTFRLCYSFLMYAFNLCKSLNASSVRDNVNKKEAAIMPVLMTDVDATCDNSIKSKSVL